MSDLPHSHSHLAGDRLQATLPQGRGGGWNASPLPQPRGLASALCWLTALLSSPYLIAFDSLSVLYLLLPAPLRKDSGKYTIGVTRRTPLQSTPHASTPPLSSPLLLSPASRHGATPGASRILQGQTRDEPRQKRKAHWRWPWANKKCQRARTA